jgi:tight adherence protein B
VSASVRTMGPQKLLAVVAAVIGVLLVLTAPASAAGEEIVLRAVDTTNFPEVRIEAQISGDITDLSQFRVRENGEFVDAIRVVPLGESEASVGIVLVIDASGSMNANGAMSAAKAAARRFVQSKLPNDEIAIVAFADEARTVVEFTPSSDRLVAAIDGLAADGETALWDGVLMASRMLTFRPELQPNIIVLSDGKDTVSEASEADARSAAIAAKGPVSAIGLSGGDFEEGPIRALTDATGGTYHATNDPAALGDAFAAMQNRVQSQFEITYSSTSQEPTLDLLVSAGEARAETTTNLGTRAEGTSVTPEVVESSNNILSGSLGKTVVGVLGALAVGLLAWVVLSMVMKEESTLTTVLRPYDEAPDLYADDDGQSDSLISTPFVQRAVAMTEDFATKRGFLSKVEWSLERADLPIRAPEALFFYGAGVFLAGILSLFLAPSFFLGVIGIILIVLAPPTAVKFLAGQRKRKFLSQLPDTLQLLSGSLRAGYSLMQGVEAVSQEVDGPMRKELRRVMTESRLGRPLEQSLDESAERMDSPDFAWAVMAIRIQREVGGNLAELLQTVAETMVSRERLRREVKALTAEGRMSAIVLGLLPIGIGMAVYIMNKPYISLLFEETIGQYMLGGAILLALVGFYWMKKTIEIEI